MMFAVSKQSLSAERITGRETFQYAPKPCR